MNQQPHRCCQSPLSRSPHASTKGKTVVYREFAFKVGRVVNDTQVGVANPGRLCLFVLLARLLGCLRAGCVVVQRVVLFRSLLATPTM